MSEAHGAHLLQALQRLDSALSEAQACLCPCTEGRVFQAYVDDASPVEKRVIADKIGAMRETLRSALTPLDIAAPESAMSAIAAIRARLAAAHGAVPDLADMPQPCRTDWSESQQRALRRMNTDLIEQLDELEAYLALGGNTLRFARWLRADAGMDSAHRLSEALRLIDKYQLTRFRSAGWLLSERMRSPRLHIGVFGRPKSGKSSFLNRLLDASVLPVGVTPVTELVVHILHGIRPIGRAEFADGTSEVFALARLAEFVSVQQNPGNIRHVDALTIQTDAAWLTSGAALVDTPGIGQVRDSSWMHSPVDLFDFDVGILLVDATSTLADEDIALVDSLVHAGAEVQLLISKADLLSPLDLERAVGFARRRAFEQLGLELPVHAVSSRAASGEVTDPWFQHELLPRVHDAHHRSLISLTRKVSILREGIRAALTRRLAATERAPELLGLNLHHAQQVLDQARQRLAEARVKSTLIADLPQSASIALDEAATNAAVLWAAHRAAEFDLCALVEASVRSRAAAVAAASSRELSDLRAMTQVCLHDANLGLSADLPRAQTPPVLELRPNPAIFTIERPLGAGFGGQALFKHMVRQAMRDRNLEDHVAQALRAFADTLQQWRGAALEALTAEFLNRIEALEPPAVSMGSALSEMAQDIQGLALPAADETPDETL